MPSSLLKKSRQLRGTGAPAARPHGWLARTAILLVSCGLSSGVVARLGEESAVPQLSPEPTAPSGCWTDAAAVAEAAPDTLRVATFNVALFRDRPGELAADLASADDQLEPGESDRQARAVAEILQRVRPDVVLLNEFDFDAEGLGLARFQQGFLSQPQRGQQPLSYPHSFIAPSNTGVPTGLDLDGDGRSDGPADAKGYGRFPGQYGMALLSRFPIVADEVRTFQNFLWREMPSSELPTDFYGAAVQAVLPLSSKSHWDLPLAVGDQQLHVLAAHPTPTVFDGPEDRNGRRNHDEIRLWADYVAGGERAGYLYDDQGSRGGLAPGMPFIILGDYNADPVDGDSRHQAMRQLLDSPAINSTIAPESPGAAEDAALEGGANSGQRGNPAQDTADFGRAGPGNLRIDYVLPSAAGLEPVCGGVFWPARGGPGRELVGDGKPVVSSDHRLVWLDLRVITDRDRPPGRNR